MINFGEIKLICKSCYNIYRLDYINMDKNCEYRCPNSLCDAQPELILVDDMMIDVIIKLRILGINTLYCCQGHLYRNESVDRPYIIIGNFDNKLSEVFKKYFEPLLTNFKNIKIRQLPEPVQVFDDDEDFEFKYLIETDHNHDLISRVNNFASFLSYLYSVIDKIIINLKNYPLKIDLDNIHKIVNVNTWGD